MPKMRSLCSLVLGRQCPRSAEYPVVLSNRTIARTVRHTQPLTQTPHPRRPTPRIVSYSITRSIRGTQIPIARDEPPSSPFPRFPPLEVFRRRPPMRAPPLRQGLRDGKRWVSCRPGFFLPVRVLSRLFRRLFLERLTAAHKQLQFFGNHTPLANAQAFAAYLAPLRKTEWVVYSKPPFGGPGAVLAYLSRYTHRVAIANSRLIAFDDDSVTFKWKDYRIEGRDRYKQMTLATDEFIRRFLIHVLPKRFHRIRHYGLLAKTSGADNIARVRELLVGPKPQSEPADADATDHNEPACPCCGGRMIIIENFPPGATPRHPPTGPNIRIHTSLQ